MDYIKDNCYLVDNCKLNSNCKYVEGTCIRFFKIDFLLTNALLSDSQKVKKKLVVDENGVDKDKFEEGYINGNTQNGINTPTDPTEITINAPYGQIKYKGEYYPMWQV